MNPNVNVFSLKPKIIHLIRHGQTDYNARGVVQGSGVDTSLNTTGQIQANSFYEAYKHEDYNLFVCSDLRRSFETLQPFLTDKSNLYRTDLINEISWGDQEGLKSTKESIAEYKRVVQEWTAGNLKASIEGGESAQSLYDRCSKFKTWLTTRTEEKILICSHGRTMRCLVCVLMDWPMSKMEEVSHHNLGIFKFKLIGNNFSLEEFNGTDHLKEMK